MAQKIAFTPTGIDALNKGRLSDPKTIGLAIEAVGRNKTFKYARRLGAAGRIVKSTLGRFPAFSIADAREWAGALNLQIDRGIDPTAKAEEDAKTGMTVADAHVLYIAAVKSGKRKTLKPRTITEKEEIWSRDVRDFIGSEPIHEITNDRLWDMGVRRNVA